MSTPAKQPDPLKGPFVVVPPPGTQGLALTVLKHGLRDEFGREFMSGTTYGFEPRSAVSLLLAGYGTAHCFDEEAAERWMKALKATDGAKEKLAGEAKSSADLMSMILARFSGPHMEKVKAEEASMRAQLEEEDRHRAEEKLKADALAAQAKLEADQAAADAAEKKRLQDAAAKEGNLSVALVDQPPALVSDANVDGDTARDPAKPEAKPEPAKESKRGDKSPRGR
jgi:hypothetical protein